MEIETNDIFRKFWSEGADFRDGERFPFLVLFMWLLWLSYANSLRKIVSVVFRMFARIVGNIALYLWLLYKKSSTKA